MSKSFDFLVFIGRFQPFHSGHLAVLREALGQSEHVILLCGSARQPRTTRNPWSFNDIEAMVRGSLEEPEAQRVILSPLLDDPYNEDRWLRRVQSIVRDSIKASIGDRVARVGLVGLSEDGDRYYPRRFPQWIPVGIDSDNKVRGTAIREALFGMRAAPTPSGAAYLASPEAHSALPAAVRHQLVDYCATETYTLIREEAEFVARYRSAWAEAPYPPVFVTVDAVVVQSGHILLVERRAQPGKGLWALPGGFLRGDETLEAACVRELRGETRLKVPAPVLRGSIRARQVFDWPYRSLRGRTITHVFQFELEPNTELPKVRGGDDARRAFWAPLADLGPERMYEDHYAIIQAMIG